jgi:hypothetical protein
LSVALLASCSQRNLQAPCNAGVCKADVELQSCADGTLSVSPDPILVPAPNNIEWTITTPGYRFAPNGIVIDGTGFGNFQLTGNGKKFIVHDDHTDRRPKIKYAVRVVRESDGLACAPYDPYIKNE